MGALFLDPGRLSARLQLQQPADISDGQGGVTDAWIAVGACWGRVEPLRAASEEMASAEMALVTHRVTIRHREDVRPTMRFVHRQRRLSIRAAYDPDETRRYLICDCEEDLR